MTLIKKIKDKKVNFEFNKEYINALILDQEVLEYFLDVLGEKADSAKTIAKRIAWPIAAYMKENYKKINELAFDKTDFKKFVDIAISGKVMDNQMKIVMDEMLNTGKKTAEIIKEKWFDAPAVDDSELKDIVNKVIGNNPAIVEQYKWGKTSTIGFFVWQVMKETWGKANPKEVQGVIKKQLG